ncbi:hypothetical protein ACSBQY_10455 [Micrococcus lylae]|uniref:hypothetical protein n=1 Tax=Micrococcus lylae TaxID=1273 RepID=UPI003EB7A7A0
MSNQRPTLDATHGGDDLREIARALFAPHREQIAQETTAMARTIHDANEAIARDETIFRKSTKEN